MNPALPDADRPQQSERGGFLNNSDSFVITLSQRRSVKSEQLTGRVDESGRFERSCQSGSLARSTTAAVGQER